MFIFEEPSLAALWSGKTMILYCGIFSGAMGYTMQVIGQKGVNPTLAAIVLSTESVFSAIGGMLFGIDSISLVGYVGCAIIFAGIIISQLDLSAKKVKE
jgi:drug/metabolite transporter (DMT)-like permease